MCNKVTFEILYIQNPFLLFICVKKTTKKTNFSVVLSSTLTWRQGKYEKVVKIDPHFNCSYSPADLKGKYLDKLFVNAESVHSLPWEADSGLRNPSHVTGRCVSSLDITNRLIYDT